VTARIPVDPVPEAGCLELVADSHRGPWLMPRTLLDEQPKWFPEKAGSIAGQVHSETGIRSDLLSLITSDLDAVDASKLSTRTNEPSGCVGASVQRARNRLTSLLPYAARQRSRHEHGIGVRRLCLSPRSMPRWRTRPPVPAVIRSRTVWITLLEEAELAAGILPPSLQMRLDRQDADDAVLQALEDAERLPLWQSRQVV
jgi:hypothetical protein